MWNLRNVPWRWLEERSSGAFVTAGTLSLLVAALFGIETVTATSRSVLVTGLLGLSAMIASFVGLAGLYPKLADREPYLARAGMAVVTIAGIGLVVFPLCLLAKTSGIPSPAPPFMVFVVAMVAIILGFLLFGLASLRSGIHSRRVGSLLLLLVVTFVLLFAADLQYGGSPAWVDFAGNAIQALVLATIGHDLSTDSAETGREDVQVDVVSG